MGWYMDYLLNPVSIKSYYVLLLVQRLAISKSSYTLSDDSNCIQALVALALKNAKNADEKKKWEEILKELGKITLELTLIEEEIREFREELAYGNILSVPESLLNKYSELIAELRKIEAEVINNLDEILEGTGIVPIISVPKGIDLKGKKRRGGKKRVSEDVGFEI